MPSARCAASNVGLKPCTSIAPPGPPPACARRLLTSPDTGSTPSRRQSPSPDAAREKRLSSGGTSFARATVIVEARSGPNQGFARPPFTGLRVVSTSNVGSTESDEADVLDPARGFEHQGLEARSDRGRKLDAQRFGARDQLLRIGNVGRRDLVHHFGGRVAEHPVGAAI